MTSILIMLLLCLYYNDLMERSQAVARIAVRTASQATADYLLIRLLVNSIYSYFRDIGL